MDGWEDADLEAELRKMGEAAVAAPATQAPPQASGAGEGAGAVPCARRLLPRGTGRRLEAAAGAAGRPRA
eukprot:10433502-Alexandrium_andersonii.AAC.1